MTIEKLEILLKDIMEEGKYIYKTFEDETYIYVFTKLEKLRGIDHDDRYAILGGPGPIVVDKQTKEFRRVHYMDVPSELHKKHYVEPTIDDIAKGIKKRQYVNESDVYNFLKLNYRGNEKFTFGEVLYDLEKDLEILSLRFKKNELRDKMINFLEVLNVKCKVEEDGWLVITRVPEQS
ncbi:hypothetical protein [Tenacibaculum maritimum]|uniref:hypothetical protein n=1 Tax=Tenacibaculum maritimum TaxID=107401 RepID=UPI0012E6409A|nr:hypothetical protein [Tenacibaculum maritimum]MCD9564197.1 hypothetical protein [Tenacibaculum maritimum]MCD9567030.1 hypothetical protein [Tenacibaculum maritimum]MCD9580245.1 hypothetical protein [Tenacibaculum maritimum]MCD9598143.1 hypothetical protein [Tenacibaculum maritimum]MCD9614908.1 hypothetical protein [Tenacibaculum maritimum]